MHYTMAENSKEECHKMPGTVSPNLIIILVPNLHSTVSMMSLLFILGLVSGSLQRTSCAVVMYLNNVVTVGGHPPCLCVVGMKRRLVPGTRKGGKKRVVCRALSKACVMQSNWILLWLHVQSFHLMTGKLLQKRSSTGNLIFCNQSSGC